MVFNLKRDRSGFRIIADSRFNVCCIIFTIIAHSIFRSATPLYARDEGTAVDSQEALPEISSMIRMAPNAYFDEKASIDQHLETSLKD